MSSCVELGLWEGVDRLFIDKDKLDTATEMILKDSNQMFVEEADQYLRDFFEKNGDQQLSSKEYTEKILLPMIAKSNNNVKQFAAALLKTAVQLPRE